MPMGIYLMTCPKGVYVAVKMITRPLYIMLFSGPLCYSFMLKNIVPLCFQKVPIMLKKVTHDVDLILSNKIKVTRETFSKYNEKQLLCNIRCFYVVL